MPSGGTSVRTSNLASGRRYARYTLKRQTSTAIQVATEPSEKKLYHLSFLSTAASGGKAEPARSSASRRTTTPSSSAVISPTPLLRSTTPASSASLQQEPIANSPALTVPQERDSALTNLQEPDSSALTNLQETDSPDALTIPQPELDSPAVTQDQSSSLPSPVEEPVNATVQALKAENELLKKCLHQLKTANEELTNDVSKQGKLAEARRFCFENIQDSDDDVLFYTGLPSSGVFYQLFQYLSPEGIRVNIVYRATAQNWAANKQTDPANAPWRETKLSQGRPPKLSQVNELFLTLVRLRLNLKEHDLARRFEISPSSVSRVFITWINYAYLRLGMLPIWPDHSIIKETMPASFKEHYPKTTTIVDATEIKVNIPSSLLLQSQTYSSYKSANTLKGLLAISPAGHVMFVSSLYTGSIADKELVERSGFLSLLRRGDEVMADRGFTIDELLAPLGVSLNTPPTLGRRSQMDGNEVVETQQIASLRIHIERAIRRVKEFDILNGVIPAALSGSANQIWTACLCSPNKLSTSSTFLLVL